MNKTSGTAIGKRSGKHFPVVAIGASAGGLEAMNELLKHLPSSTGMAYVYIQHMDASHQDILSSILAKNTAMKVQEAKHLLPLEKDNLYIIPANKDISIIDGVMTLNTRPDKPATQKPIDYFFSMLAEKQKDGAIGIVLSGSANDGTLGLKAIKSAGGLTFAQDESAKFQSMPKSAIADGVVDMVLSPKEIAKELERLGKQADAIQSAMLETGTDEEEPENKDEDLGSIIQILKKSTGVDFTHYKMSTIKRRIIRRMLLHKIENINDYTQFLKQHTSEVTVLYQDLLINVTTFFRDPDAMEYLKKTLFPRIAKNASSSDPIRIWVPACSTGEEAYSIAMILMEVLGDRAATTPIQIFATDLSEIAIAKARLGLYSQNEVMDVSAKRLQRFFTKVDGSYRIVKTIRDLCVFAPHNIFKDPPFSRLDFISCCNLMIYLDTVLQKKILATFHYALNLEGYLMLGKSETIGAAAQLFTQLEKKFKIYARKKEVPSKAMFELTYRLPDVDHLEVRDSPRRVPARDAVHAPDLDKIVDNVLLTKYIPASVVVNQELEILQFRGSTGMFLEPSPGKASLSLLKMAKPGLAFELRNAIHKANKSWQTIKKAGLEMNSNGQGHNVSIEVLPLKADSEERLFLVVFELLRTSSSADAKASFSKDKLVKQLQDELSAVKEDMRSIIEEQEASNEELQSANEEIVSSNEELQSINEELETSKEEVESTNEELMTINTELQVRNEQLAEAYEYAEAVFATIREAVIVLDNDLRVRSANRAFYKIFNAKEDNTEGLLIYEVNNRQWDIPALHTLLEDMLPNNSQLNGHEIEHDFAQAGKKVLLLNARRIVQKIHRQQLILLAIEDITEHRNAEGRSGVKFPRT
jgi:two-component system, chemotaxis family, CheB/CheR fusion protein